MRKKRVTQFLPLLHATRRAQAVRVRVIHSECIPADIGGGRWWSVAASWPRAPRWIVRLAREGRLWCDCGGDATRPCAHLAVVLRQTRRAYRTIMAPAVKSRREHRALCRALDAAKTFDEYRAVILSEWQRMGYDPALAADVLRLAEKSWLSRARSGALT